METKWNLGCFNRLMDGYENLDIVDGRLAYPLTHEGGTDLEDDSLDEIYASHILEHFSYKDTFDVCNHWASKLKVGGVLKIAVPDLEKILPMYKDNPDPKFIQYLFGDHRDEHNKHEAVFDEESLRKLMEAAGLEDIKPWVSEYTDDASLPVSLNLMGVKAETKTVKRTMAAVMSVPRLGFTDNTKSLVLGFPPGVNVRQGQGVFWDQVLTRMLIDAVNEGNDYIFTVDYDTWFTQAHVFALLRLMEENPDFDAIFPVQIKRQNETVMVGAEGKTKFTEEDLKLPVIPAVTGHFGLTVFRRSAFEGLKHPWFLGVPNEDGMWEENRLDPDIYFWHNFKKCGKKLGLAQTVIIGHMQLMCTFPGKAGSGAKIVHEYMSDVNEKGCPSWCMP